MAKGQISLIRELLNDDLSVNSYEVVIDFKDKPNFKLGNCEVKQK